MKNFFYAQSGGVTAVINATAGGVIEEARRHPEDIGKVFAGRNGIVGALEEDLIDTSAMSDAEVAKLRYLPGGVFGSCRFKLPNYNIKPALYQRLADIFRAHDIDTIIYNGGGDSSDTAYKLSENLKSIGYPITAIGVPKTIDNDLPVTDCCPGFGSVAKYVATSIREAALDVASMAKTSTKVFILEVMGRHAGWITAACGLAARDEQEAPHILLFPELPFERNVFLSKVKQTVEEHGYCVIAVSEGIRDHAGQFLAQSGTHDAFGHAQLGGTAPRLAEMVQTELTLKTHWAVSDYLQRAARHLASRTDVEQAHALGCHAVKMARKGCNGMMPVIRRLSDEPYRWDIYEVELSQVANMEKKLPASFMDKEGFGITEACRRYLQPLIAGEDHPPYHNGLPDYLRFKPVRVVPKLPAYSEA